MIIREIKTKNQNWSKFQKAVHSKPIFSLGLIFSVFHSGSVKHSYFADVDQRKCHKFQALQEL